MRKRSCFGVTQYTSNEKLVRLQTDAACFADDNSQEFLKIIYLSCGYFHGFISKKLCHLTAPLLLCMDSRVTIETKLLYNLKAISLSFLPEFINLHLSDSLIYQDDYIQLAEANGFPCMNVFTAPCDRLSILPLERWNQSVAERLFYLFENEITDVESESCRLRAILLDILNLTDVLHRRIQRLHRDRTEIDPVFLASEYIEINYAKNISLQKLCKIAGLNRNILNARFKEHFGMTVQKYITKNRIRRARELLATTAWKLEVIAHECGYDDVSYFIRVFRKQECITPEAFRQQCYIKRRNL